MTRVFKLCRQFGDWAPGTYVLAANAEDPASGFVLADAAKIDTLRCISAVSAVGLFAAVPESEYPNPPARRALMYAMREHLTILETDLQAAERKLDHMRAIKVALSNELYTLSVENGDE